MVREVQQRHGGEVLSVALMVCLLLGPLSYIYLNTMDTQSDLHTDTHNHRVCGKYSAQLQRHHKHMHTHTHTHTVMEIKMQ